MPNYDFSKIAKQLYLNHTSAWVFSCKIAAYLQNTFSLEHLWIAASEMLIQKTGICKSQHFATMKIMTLNFQWKAN